MEYEHDVIEKEKPSKEVEVKPLKDFIIKHNDFYFELIKGEKISIPKMFIPNLKTEKVIK